MSALSRAKFRCHNKKRYSLGCRRLGTDCPTPAGNSGALAS